MENCRSIDGFGGVLDGAKVGFSMCEKKPFGND